MDEDDPLYFLSYEIRIVGHRICHSLGLVAHRLKTVFFGRILILVGKCSAGCDMGAAFSANKSFYRRKITNPKRSVGIARKMRRPYNPTI